MTEHAMATAAVGIIMPVFNAERTLARALASIQSQTWQDWHLYLVEDNSTDNSLTLLRQYLADKRITLLENPANIGAAQSRNRGLAHAAEPIIAFIDSDDAWQPEKLTQQLQRIEDGAELVITAYYYHRRSERVVVAYPHGQLTRQAFLKKQFRVCFSSVCFVRPPSMPQFADQGHEDFLFLYQLFTHFTLAEVINSPLVSYYVQPQSLSSHKGRAAKWHFALLKSLFAPQWGKIVYYYFWYAVNGMLFKFKQR